jgi:hypothetical protein
MIAARVPQHPHRLRVPPHESLNNHRTVGNIPEARLRLSSRASPAVLLVFCVLFFRLVPSAPGLILCLAVALLGRPPCAHAADTVDVTGSNFYVDTKTGHIGIGTGQPASAVDAGTGEVKVGSSGAACARAIKGLAPHFPPTSDLFS